MTYILASIAGGFGCMLISWLISLYGSRRGGNIGRQRPIFTEGRTIRGNGSGGPSTPKPELLRRGSNHPSPNFKPPPPAGPPLKPQPAGGRLYRGGQYRMKDSDIWYPVGTEPDWAELAQEQVQRRSRVTGDDL